MCVPELGCHFSIKKVYLTDSCSGRGGQSGLCFMIVPLLEPRSSQRRVGQRLPDAGCPFAEIFSVIQIPLWAILF